MTMRELMTATLYSNRNLTDGSKQKGALKYPHILSFQEVQNALSHHLIFLLLLYYLHFLLFFSLIDNVC